MRIPPICFNNVKFDDKSLLKELTEIPNMINTIEKPITKKTDFIIKFILALFVFISDTDEPAR